MHVLSQLLLFVAICIDVRTCDLAISAGRTRDWGRVVLYGLAGLFLLVAIIINLLGLR